MIRSWIQVQKAGRSKRLHACSSQVAKQGFTLLELLLSLALSVALLSAIFTSLFSYYRWRDAGERQIEHARSWLAVTHRIGADLLHAGRVWGQGSLDEQIFREAFNGGAQVEPNEQTSEVAERVLDFGGDFTLDPLVLFGDSDSLTLGQLAPASSLSTSSANKAALVQVAVVWSSKPAESWRVPCLNTAGQVVFRAVTNASAIANSVSLVSPQRRISKQNVQAPVVQRTMLFLDNPLRITEQVTYPADVQAIHFRYFDGQQWHASWNSQQSKRLPIAVEATFSQSESNGLLTQVFPIATVSGNYQSQVPR